ncbi:MAG: VOC family protein [Phycisphaerales bacterium]
MRISVCSVCVDDQAKALAFYTEKLGFTKKQDIPVGEHRWLTVTGDDGPDSVELVLEPDAHPASKTFKAALIEDGIPWTMFSVDDVQSEYERLKGIGVRFTQKPTDLGTCIVAVLDDTCGNLIQLFEEKAGT